MKVIILCGGSGTRLWPLSRKSYPKQFLKINDNYSFLQKTVKRFLSFLAQDEIFLVTNKEQKFLILNQLQEIGFDKEKNLIFEPVGKNTAPAIAYALNYINEKFSINDNETIFISPSDHLISPVEQFIKFIENGNIVANLDRIVTFGVEPDKPETGYGYIKKGEKLDFDFEVFEVEKFVEKPDLDTAKNYLDSKQYLWNSGMFLFNYKTIKNEFKKQTKNIYKLMTGSYEDFKNNFAKLQNISIDYAIMEKTEKISVLPLQINWSDIGSWDSVYELMPKDESGNIKTDKVICEETKNSMFIVNGKIVASIGLDDIMVVETDDAVLISKKGTAQKVKNIVEKLSAKKDFKEITETHTMVNRPWGSFKTLEKSDRYKIKKIVVKQGEKLSLQKHYHRSEHWVVVRGTAKVTVNDKEFLVHENESIYVPKSAKHRLENPGKLPLEIIEVQVGEYVDEDDIVRYDDFYGRS